MDSRYIAAALQGGVFEPEPPLSDAMKAYLRVFDRYLKTWARGSPEEERRARLECRYMLGAIYVEQGFRRAA